jgi:PPOX class probable FMN-dependent enzyme
MDAAASRAPDTAYHPPIVDTIDSMAALRELLGTPSAGAVRKDVGRLDEHCRTFIARSPFALLGSADAEGRCDVSPKGDVPGFALVLDEQTLVIPERPGNRRGDTLGNVVVNPEIGVLFVVPGTEHTLRVNGRARLARDPWLLERLQVQGRAPLLAIVVEVREAYFHCAKAFRRSRLWEPERYAGPDELATLGCVLRDQLSMENITAEHLDQQLEAGYRTTLY